MRWLLIPSIAIWGLLRKLLLLLRRSWLLLLPPLAIKSMLLAIGTLRRVPVLISLPRWAGSWLTRLH